MVTLMVIYFESFPFLKTSLTFQDNWVEILEVTATSLPCLKNAWSPGPSSGPAPPTPKNLPSLSFLHILSSQPTSLIPAVELAFLSLEMLQRGLGESLIDSGLTLKTTIPSKEFAEAFPVS